MNDGVELLCVLYRHKYRAELTEAERIELLEFFSKKDDEGEEEDGTK